MKSNKYLVATLIILIGVGAITVSCQKDQSQPRTIKAKISAVENPVKTGEDDEDPIIQGKVKKNNNSPVSGATVETIGYGAHGTIDTSYTNSLGEFTQKVSPGVYYFRVTPPYSSPQFVTDTVRITGNTLVTITID